MWKIYALLSAIFAGATAVLAKAGMKNVNGNVATAIRTVVILFIAWSIVFFAGQMKEVKLLTKNNLFFLILSGMATGLSWIFYFKALESGPVSKIVPIDKLSLVVAIILAAIFLRETLDWKTYMGGALILAGTFLLIK